MIYIGIPAHDERHTLGPLLWRIRELLAGDRREFHVLVVDDASTDGTLEVLEPYPRVLPLTVLRNETRQGYAAGLKRIIDEALKRSDYVRRDALVTLQADFSDSPDALPEMVRRFEGGADLVSVRGERTPGGARKWVRRGARFLAPAVARCDRAADPFSSLRLYRLVTLRRAVDSLEEGETLLDHEGWAADAELLARTWPHVRRAAEVASDPDYGRRYRESRYRGFRELREIMGVSRQPFVRACVRQLEDAES